MTKRLFDLVASSLGLVILGPILLFIALWIKLDTPGPVFFRQQRVGRYGRLFRIHKFRTMVVNAENLGLQITIGPDRRITRSGVFLRSYKLDELPQLIDVVIGNMSLVGPRPEVPKYVALYPSAIRDIVLSVRPGITDQASIEFRDENSLLAQSADPEKTYIDEILPMKLAHYERYATEHSLRGDATIILKTIDRILRRSIA